MYGDKRISMLQLLAAQHVILHAGSTTLTEQIQEALGKHGGTRDILILGGGDTVIDSSRGGEWQVPIIPFWDDRKPGLDLEELDKIMADALRPSFNWPLRLECEMDFRQPTISHFPIERKERPWEKAKDKFIPKSGKNESSPDDAARQRARKKRKRKK